MRFAPSVKSFERNIKSLLKMLCSPEKGGEIMGVAADTICRCMKKKKLRQKTVAASLNENPRQINQQLRRMDDIKVERFCKYADALGYDVAVIDRESGEVEKLDPAKNNL